MAASASVSDVRDALARQAAAGAAPADVAAAVARVWYAIFSALLPVVGHRGVWALYRRSLFIAARSFRWLEGAPSVPESMDLPGLVGVLARRDAAEAAAAGSAMLDAFDELITALIGPALAAQLLAPVWAHFAGGRGDQDPPS